MKYIYADSLEPVIEKTYSTISGKLTEGQKVLWLLSGGSGGKVCVAVAKKLAGQNLENLFVTLTDERYGPVGHENENWQILVNDGFDLPGATTYRPLRGLTEEGTALQMSEWLNAIMAEVDYSIGVFGVGADGHTSGVKPYSTAVHAKDSVVHFIGEDFSRITTTPYFLRKIDEAVVQLFGTEKHSVVAQLLHRTMPIDEQPAQLLKNISNLTIYSDLESS